MSHKDIMTKFSSLRLLSINRISDHHNSNTSSTTPSSTTPTTNTPSNNNNPPIISYDQESNIHKPLDLYLHFPDSFKYHIRVSNGDTIQSTKKKLSEELLIPSPSLVLYLNDNIMIDPLSFSDFEHIRNKDQVNINVKVIGNTPFNKEKTLGNIERRKEEIKGKVIIGNGTSGCSSLTASPLSSSPKLGISLLSLDSINNRMDGNNTPSSNMDPLLTPTSPTTSFKSARRHSVQPPPLLSSSEDDIKQSNNNNNNNSTNDTFNNNNNNDNNNNNSKDSINELESASKSTSTSVSFKDNLIISNEVSTLSSSNNNNNNVDITTPSTSTTTSNTTTTTSSTTIQSPASRTPPAMIMSPTNNRTPPSTSQQTSGSPTSTNTNTNSASSMLSPSHRKTHLRIGSLAADLSLTKTLERDYLHFSDINNNTSNNSSVGSNSSQSSSTNSSHTNSPLNSSNTPSSSSSSSSSTTSKPIRNQLTKSSIDPPIFHLDSVSSSENLNETKGTKTTKDTPDQKKT